jgi:hypothetical protein
VDVVTKIKYIALFLTIFLFIPLFISSSFARQWTILLYCDADSYLDLAGVNDLNELELAGSTPEVAIIVLLDRNGFNDTHLYYVNYDPQGLPGGDDSNIISTVIDTLAPWMATEEDMGNPNTLKDFLLWGMRTYPSEHYLLSIWDNGMGIFKKTGNEQVKGECWDDHGGIPGEYIDLRELKEVLDSAYIVNGNKKIDIVGHDTCLLGQIEMFYQMAPFVKIGIASESWEPREGWDYEHSFKDLVLNPFMPAETLAAKIVNYTVDSYLPNEFSNTQAAVNLDSLKSAFMPIFNDFAISLYMNMYSYDSVITEARSMAENYYDYHYAPSYAYAPNFELYHFAKILSQNKATPPDLRSKAFWLMYVYSKTVIAAKHGPRQPYASGFTIWFPDDYETNPHKQDYLTKIDFSSEYWDEFLAMFDNPHLVTRGDFDQDGMVDVSDLVFLINRLFYQGTTPAPLFIGDINCNDVVDIKDVVFLIDYLFYQGSSPCF